MYLISIALTFLPLLSFRRHAIGKAGWAGYLHQTTCGAASHCSKLVVLAAHRHRFACGRVSLHVAHHDVVAVVVNG